jgi:hypothetical protein
MNEVAMSRIIRGVFQVSETVCRHHRILNLIGSTKRDLNLNFFQGYTQIRSKISAFQGV